MKKESPAVRSNPTQLTPDQLQRRRAYQRKWRDKNRQKWNKQCNERLRLLRLLVINGYGGRCACCKETEIKFLAIDHKYNGRGNPAKRHTNKKSMYKWILRNNFPDELQLLCHNCNLSKGSYGACPHTDFQKSAA